MSIKHIKKKSRYFYQTYNKTLDFFMICAKIENVKNPHLTIIQLSKHFSNFLETL